MNSLEARQARVGDLVVFSAAHVDEIYLAVADHLRIYIDVEKCTGIILRLDPVPRWHPPYYKFEVCMCEDGRSFTVQIRSTWLNKFVVV